jgi:hypothetical protein
MVPRQEERDRHESWHVRRGSGRMTSAFGHVGVTKSQTMGKGWWIVLVTTLEVEAPDRMWRSHRES